MGRKKYFSDFSRFKIFKMVLLDNSLAPSEITERLKVPHFEARIQNSKVLLTFLKSLTIKDEVSMILNDSGIKLTVEDPSKALQGNAYIQKDLFRIFDLRLPRLEDAVSALSMDERPDNEDEPFEDLGGLPDLDEERSQEKQRKKRESQRRRERELEQSNDISFQIEISSMIDCLSMFGQNQPVLCMRYIQGEKLKLWLEDHGVVVEINAVTRRAQPL